MCFVHFNKWKCENIQILCKYLFKCGQTVTMVKCRNIQSCRQSKCLPHLLYIFPLFRTTSLFFYPFLPLPHPPSLSLSIVDPSLSLSGTRIYAQFLFTNFGKCRTSVCPLRVCVCVRVRLLCCTI